MIEIRRAKKEDKNNVIELWKYCFSDSDDFVKYYFDNCYRDENAVVLNKNEKLSAMLHLNKYKLNINKNVYDSSYVVGVSVFPEYRGQGLMNRLIKKSLNMQYDEGEVFSILMPIETDIYTRYGYINCFNINEYEISLNDINYKKTNNIIKRVEKLDNDTIYDLNFVYESVMKNYNVYNVRDEHYWQSKHREIKLENGNIFLVYEGSQVVGYFYLFHKNGEKGLVSEMLFLSYKSYDCILNFIKSHSTQFKKVTIITPQGYEFDILSNNSNKYTRKIKPFMMGRVINASKVLEEVLENLDLENVKNSFKIEILDNHIEKNNIVFTHSKTDKAEKILKMDISILAQIYTKFASFREVSFSDKVQTNDFDFFASILDYVKQDNFINEYF